MPYVLRDFAPSDLEQIIELSLRAWAPVFASFREVLGNSVYFRVYPAWEDSQAEDVRRVCTSSDFQILVAADEEVLGFAAFQIDLSTATGLIEMIAVDPNVQRQGAGAALLAGAANQMRKSGCSLVHLMTGGDEGHAPARRLYERIGFTPLPLVHYYQQL